MPRKTSDYWSSMDFDSEEDISRPQARVYVDPWDLENYAFMRRHLEDTPEPSSPRSPAGEPTSSSFYYVHNGGSLQRTIPSADSPTLFAGIDELDFHNENFEAPYDYGVYCDYAQDRKRNVPRPMDTSSSLSSNNENYVYTTDGCDPTSADASLIYVYETARRKRKIALPKSSRKTSSLVKPTVGKFRRIRNIDCMECSLLESAGFFDGYDLDLHQVPSIQMRPPPENFGLSPYGHLKIDYSCSWHSLDRLIKSSER